ncbi:MAG TPA: 2OG-Fe(II) oxygenase [Novosphingobium sp.]|nr:2OG-Fe(II) oxygenase [Novosphingobium sp.]
MPGLDLFDDALEPRLARLVIETARRWVDESAFDRTNAGWEHAIVRASEPVLIRDFGGPIGETIVAALHQRGVLPHRAYGLMLYAWPPASYIAWHSDGRHDDAVTVYLNPSWDRDWGGLFLYEDDAGDIRAVLPRFNLALRNSAKLPHATTPVTADAPEPRFTLQLFPRAPGSA